MKKIKENKIWFTVIIFGLIIVSILIMILQQQKSSTIQGQEESYSASVRASSSAQESQDEADQNAYAKKAAKMKGRVLHLEGNYFTTWTKDDFIKWATKYRTLSMSDKQKAHSNFGTSRTYYEDGITLLHLNNIAGSIIDNDFSAIGYYSSVEEFNNANPSIDPDTIQK
ncbi:hypothetical protein LNP18_06115 [Leuconostoc citreum]|uniref:hypothetical protein n=1 Tax=Leuconostoc citreum TaxID=33964 RepID=UPI00200AC314|nr:hypothetical protein [Leuconostoc citreum]MCK8605677.1 hypothetical protein [Leuconostoc citreum]